MSAKAGAAMSNTARMSGKRMELVYHNSTACLREGRYPAHSESLRAVYRSRIAPKGQKFTTTLCDSQWAIQGYADYTAIQATHMARPIDLQRRQKHR